MYWGSLRKTTYELGNEVDKLKQFICEKDEKLLQIERKERNLLHDIEHITVIKNNIELVKGQAEEYHNRNISLIKIELATLQNKLDESHQNELKMKSNISELKSTTENLQLEITKKTKAYEEIAMNLEEKLTEECSAKHRITNKLETAKIEHTNFESN